MPTPGYPDTRYHPLPLVDLSMRAERERPEPAALRSFFNIMATMEGSRRGCARAPRRRHQRAVLRDEEEPGTRARRPTAHAHLVSLGIFKALNILYSGELADQWVRLPNQQSDLRRSDAARLHDRAAACRRCRSSAACSMPAAPAEARRRRADPACTTPIASSRRSTGRRRASSPRIADDDADLGAIFDLDRPTNDRLLAEHSAGPISASTSWSSACLIPTSINAAFCHAHPLGARFNGPDRGAWYAASSSRTAQAEVAFHRSIELVEIDWLEEEVATYDDYLADFSGEFHDLRRDRGSRHA